MRTACILMIVALTISCSNGPSGRNDASSFRTDDKAEKDQWERQENGFARSDATVENEASSVKAKQVIAELMKELQ